MFADARSSKIYVTTDEGDTFRSYSIPVDPRTLKVHPTMTGWILGHGRYQVLCVAKIVNLAIYVTWVYKICINLLH